MNVIERKNGLALVINYDECPCSPRNEFSNLGTMTICTRHHSLYENDHDDSPIALSLPICGYSHGGTGFYVGVSYDRFDGGRAGEIHTTENKIREWFGVDEITPDILQRATRQLENEVELFSKWANGEVYEWLIYSVPDLIHDEDVMKYGEYIDGCCGYYDEDVCKSEGMDAFSHELKTRYGALTLNKEQLGAVLHYVTEPKTAM